jgi:4-alpha-glucanotransferase
MGQRTSGLLLHPTALPGPFGIGEIGAEAHRFADFLHASRQGLWQVLPLGPTGYGDSPYQCFSAFAGNPLLVSLERLAKDGLLTGSDLKKAPAFPSDGVDYGAVIDFKRPLLEKAFERFEKKARPEQREDFEKFQRDSAEWLDDFALFMALKAARGGEPWNAWEEQLVNREPEALARARQTLAREVRSRAFAQYLFFRQWEELRGRCHALGVRIVGDLPIFVAHDSSDVWAHPDLFHLAADGRPAFVAGVPPDYFSATGQLWGNPLYRWDVLAKTGYRWWIERFRATLSLVDLVRLDHFRGFEACWEVPGDEDTAVHGRWAKGPGATLFEAVEAALGPLPIIAENLGVITPEVEVLRERFGWPGMAILQFAFGSDDPLDGFKPHNYPRDRVVYTGTHDNDTTVGWWTGGVGDTTRKPEQVEAERALCRKYLGIDGREIHWDFIRAVLMSVADTAIIPLQDVLGLGSETRMNLPGRASGNWRWRFEASALTDGVRDRLREMTEMYGRATALGAKGRTEADLAGVASMKPES